MDLTLYWFMFPVSIGVATLAMLSGIGGAALFTPIFILIFPLLGPEYPLSSTVAAIGSALLTETFGFTSGFIGYYRRRLIDPDIVLRFIRISVPVAIAGAFLANFVPGGLLILGYAVLVFVIALVHVFVRHESSGIALEGNYVVPRVGFRGAVYTSVGAFLTGMVSVGIGEVIVPQLTKRGIPIATAVAASVAIVIVTVACASITLVTELVREDGIDAMPWNLVMYTIPGVLIGGQIGPRLQGIVSHRAMEYGMAGLFVVLSVAMGTVALRKLGIA